MLLEMVRPEREQGAWRVLLSEAEFRDKGFVPLHILPLDIVEHAPALPYLLEEADP
jgi:hypothetical protein